MKEEDTILRKAGTGNCFKAPEGYFENLTSEVMSKLPEKDNTFEEVAKVTLWDRAKPWVYMAAMFIGAALIIRVASPSKPTIDADAVVIVDDTDTQDLSDQDINTVLNGSMFDDYALYVYLSDASVDE